MGTTIDVDAANNLQLPVGIESRPDVLSPSFIRHHLHLRRSSVGGNFFGAAAFEEGGGLSITGPASAKSSNLSLAAASSNRVPSGSGSGISSGVSSANVCDAAGGSTSGENTERSTIGSASAVFSSIGLPLERQSGQKSSAVASRTAAEINRASVINQPKAVLAQLQPPGSSSPSKVTVTRPLVPTLSFHQPGLRGMLPKASREEGPTEALVPPATATTTTVIIEPGRPAAAATAGAVAVAVAAARESRATYTETAGSSHLFEVSRTEGQSRSHSPSRPSSHDSDYVGGNRRQGDSSSAASSAISSSSSSSSSSCPLSGRDSHNSSRSRGSSAPPLLDAFATLPQTSNVSTPAESPQGEAPSTSIGQPAASSSIRMAPPPSATATAFSGAFPPPPPLQLLLKQLEPSPAPQSRPFAVAAAQSLGQQLGVNLQLKLGGGVATAVPSLSLAGAASRGSRRSLRKGGGQGSTSVNSGLMMLTDRSLPLQSHRESAKEEEETDEDDGHGDEGDQSRQRSLRQARTSYAEEDEDDLDDNNDNGDDGAAALAQSLEASIYAGQRDDDLDEDDEDGRARARRPNSSAEEEEEEEEEGQEEETAEEIFESRAVQLARYERVASQILPWLYLSGSTPAQDPEVVRSLSIKLVINCAADCCKNPFEFGRGGGFRRGTTNKGGLPGSGHNNSSTSAFHGAASEGRMASADQDFNTSSVFSSALPTLNNTAMNSRAPSVGPTRQVTADAEAPLVVAAAAAPSEGHASFFKTSPSSGLPDAPPLAPVFGPQILGMKGAGVQTIHLPPAPLPLRAFSKPLASPTYTRSEFSTPKGATGLETDEESAAAAVGGLVRMTSQMSLDEAQLSMPLPPSHLNHVRTGADGMPLPQPLERLDSEAAEEIARMSGARLGKDALSLLKHANVTSVASQLPSGAGAPLIPWPVSYVTLFLLDGLAQDIFSLFFRVISAIEAARASGSHVLVHCQQGVSRSTSFVIAYLMWAGQMSFRDAYAFVRACRPIAGPNMSFMVQLIEFEKFLATLSAPAHMLEARRAPSKPTTSLKPFMFRLTRLPQLYFASGPLLRQAATASGLAHLLIRYRAPDDEADDEDEEELALEAEMDEERTGSPADKEKSEHGHTDVKSGESVPLSPLLVSSREPANNATAVADAGEVPSKLVSVLGKRHNVDISRSRAGSSVSSGSHPESATNVPPQGHRPGREEDSRKSHLRRKLFGGYRHTERTFLTKDNGTASDENSVPRSWKFVSEIEKGGSAPPSRADLGAALLPPQSVPVAAASARKSGAGTSASHLPLPLNSLPSFFPAALFASSLSARSAGVQSGRPRGSSSGGGGASANTSAGHTDFPLFSPSMTGLSLSVGPRDLSILSGTGSASAAESHVATRGRRASSGAGAMASARGALLGHRQPWQFVLQLCRNDSDRQLTVPTQSLLARSEGSAFVLVVPRLIDAAEAKKVGNAALNPTKTQKESAASILQAYKAARASSLAEASSVPHKEDADKKDPSHLLVFDSFLFIGSSVAGAAGLLEAADLGEGKSGEKKSETEGSTTSTQDFVALLQSPITTGNKRTRSSAMPPLPSVSVHQPRVSHFRFDDFQGSVMDLDPSAEEAKQQLSARHSAVSSVVSSASSAAPVLLHQDNPEAEGKEGDASAAASASLRLHLPLPSATRGREGPQRRGRNGSMMSAAGMASPALSVSSIPVMTPRERQGAINKGGLPLQDWRDALSFALSEVTLFQQLGEPTDEVKEAISSIVQPVLEERGGNSSGCSTARSAGIDSVTMARGAFPLSGDDAIIDNAHVWWRLKGVCVQGVNDQALLEQLEVGEPISSFSPPSRASPAPRFSSFQLTTSSAGRPPLLAIPSTARASSAETERHDLLSTTREGQGLDRSASSSSNDSEMADRDNDNDNGDEDERSAHLRHAHAASHHSHVVSASHLAEGSQHHGRARLLDPRLTR